MTGHSAGSDALKKIRVLIADDDQRILMLARDVLERFGFSRVLLATNGKEAIEKMRQHAVDIVVCDWVMEPMDGLALTNYLRNHPDSPNHFVPIIMLTGRAERANIELARDAGITEFLAKPFTPVSFRNRVIEVFERPREFVFCPSYTGPSRRRREEPFPDDEDRRKS